MLLWFRELRAPVVSVMEFCFEKKNLMIYQPAARIRM